MIWRDGRDVPWKTTRKKPEWTILDAMSPQNNDHPQKREDNIVIEK